MSILETEISKLTPSRAIYKVELSDSYYSGKSIRFQKENRVCNTGDSDVVSKLVNKNYREYFVKPGVYSIDKNHIKFNALNDIKEAIIQFILHNFEQKNPLKTAVGRWYYDSQFFKAAEKNTDIEKAVVCLWKYMVEKTNDMAMTEEERSKHRTNVVNVLHFLYEKYNQTYPTPEPMRNSRRRRRRF